MDFWAWGIPVPRLPRSRYFIARGKVIFVRPVRKVRFRPRKPLVKLAFQRRQVRGKVRLGRPTKLPFRVYRRLPLVLLADQRKQVRGRVRLGKVVRRFAPGKGKPILRKLVVRSPRYAGKGKIKPTGVYGGIPAPIVGKRTPTAFPKRTFQRKPVRGQVYRTPYLATATVKPPVRRPIIKLVVRSRRYAGKGKVKPTPVYGSNTAPFVPGLIYPQAVLQRHAFQRKQVRGKVRLGKPVRTFSAIVQPKRVPLRRLLARQRRFIRGRVYLGKPVRSFAAVVQPKRHPIRVKLAAQRRQVRGRVRLGRPVITFNRVLFLPNDRAILNLAKQRKAVRGQVLITPYIATATVRPPIRPILVKLVPKRKVQAERHRGRVKLYGVVRTFTPPSTPNTHRLFLDETSGELYLRVTPTTQIITPL